MGWTLDQLMGLPVEYYDVLVEMVNEQNAKASGGDGMDYDMDKMAESKGGAAVQ